MRRVMSKLDDLLLVVVLAAGGAFGYRAVFVDDTGRDASSSSPSSSTFAAVAQQRRAIDALATLPVKGRAPKNDYDRGQFGERWKDVDRNGCDQRNDVLQRDLVDVTFKPGTHDCVVTSGVLHDPYTSRTIDFVKGNKTSTAVQIDHVVALADAWQKGAKSWDADKRESFANDPLNLLAVDGAANQAKRDGDAATWLPKNASFRCEYVARQVAVKAAYGLWVTSAERDAIARILDGCPDQPLPARRGAP